MHQSALGASETKKPRHFHAGFAWLWPPGLLLKIKCTSMDINPITLKSNTFHFKQSALVQSRFSGKQDPSSATKHPMPWQAAYIWSTKRPGYLTCGPRMPCCAGHTAIGCDLSPWYAPHRFLNILEIAHLLPKGCCGRPLQSGFCRSTARFQGSGGLDRRASPLLLVLPAFLYRRKMAFATETSLDHQMIQCYQKLRAGPYRASALTAIRQPELSIFQAV